MINKETENDFKDNKTAYSNCKVCNKFMQSDDDFCSDLCKAKVNLCPACLKVFTIETDNQDTCSKRCYISNASWYL